MKIKLSTLQLNTGQRQNKQPHHKPTTSNRKTKPTEHRPRDQRTIQTTNDQIQFPAVREMVARPREEKTTLTSFVRIVEEKGSSKELSVMR